MPRKAVFLFVFALASSFGIGSGEVWGQTSVQNFGTGTGSFTSQTGSTTFIPNPTSGTTWARAGNTATSATINLATTSNPLGTTDVYLRGIASTSAVVAKFSPMVGYTGSTEFYTSFKVLFGDASAGNLATSGEWAFYQGAGAIYSDANDFAGAQVFTGLKFTYGAGGALALTYRGGSNWSNANLTTSTFSSATVYTIEIIGNNKSSGAISYNYNGNAETVAVQKYDLYINGALVGNDLAEALFPANTQINSNTFIGTNSTSNAANIFVDDIVVYNSVPTDIASNLPTLSVSPSTLSGFSYLQGNGPSSAQTYTLSGSNLNGYPGNINISGSSNYEVSDDNITFGPSLNVPFSGSTLANTTIYVRLKAGLSASPYNEAIANSGGGATTRNVSCSGSVTLSGSSLVVISQVYGGGGNSGSTYKNDFIELYNRGTTSVDLTNWSVQYASSTGTTWQVTNLNSYTLAPGQYYLVKEDGGSTGLALPAPDATGTISMSSTAGKVALVYNTTVLSGFHPTGSNIIDFVGYGAANGYEGDGPTATPSNTASVFRAAGGCQDTDHNIYDFSAATPIPRNTATTIATCPLTPTLALYNATLSGLTYTLGNGPSPAQVFRLSGKYLNGSSITVTGSANYEVSLNNITFSSTVSVPYSSATLGWTPVYVRLKAGLAINTYNNEIISNAGGGAATLNVTCNGSVTPVSTCPSGLPLYENFNYAAGTLLSSSGSPCWATHSTSIPPNSISISAGSIFYPCYQSSGIGNEVTLATSGDDVNIAFTSQSSGSVYASFLVNVTSSQTAGDYFFNLIPTPINTTFQGRVFIKKDPSSTKFAFGLNKGNNAGSLVYTPYDYDLSNTYLVVLKYTFNSGSTTNDVVSLFINPVLSSPEPSPIMTVSDATTTDLTNAGFIALRQGTAASAPTLKLDGIRVSTNWADITTPTPTPAITASDETSPACFSAAAQTTSLTYSAAAGNPIAYSIDWDAAANATGLADQGTTSFSFQSGGGILTGIAITANTPAGTTYTGILNLQNITGCPGSQTIKLTVNAFPTITVTPSAEIICSGSSVTLTASGASTYSWSPTSGLNQSTGAVVVASPVSTTNYLVTGTTNSCSASMAVNIDVMEVPDVSLVASPSQCEGTLSTFTASPAGNYFEFFLNGVSQGPPSLINTFTPVSALTNGDQVCVTAFPIPPLNFDGAPGEKVWATPLATSAGGPPTSGFDPSRLDAIYMHSIPDYLAGFLAGNLIDGGNNDRILMFIDCRAGGYNTLASWTNRSNAPYWSMENLRSGTTFDPGFTPEYILGINRTGGVVYFNLYNMTTNVDNYIGSTPGNPILGFTPNSNTGDYTKGFEFAIPLSALGNPTGTIKVFPMIVDRPTAQGESVDPTYLSNQFLTRANSGEGNYTDVAVNFGDAAPNPVSMPLSAGGCTSQACLIIGNQWTGATSNDWAFPGNWCTGIIPNSGTDVIIANVPNKPVINSNSQADCRNIEIQPGATVTIESDLTHSGSLIINGSSSGTGTITYNRYLETNKWYILSSPVNNSSNQTTFTDANLDFMSTSYNIADLLEASNTWNYRPSLTFPLINGKGYLAKLKASASNMLSFTGTPNNTLTDVAVQSTGTYLGWNAVGNPFTSALKISDATTGFLDINSTKLEDSYAAIYLWSANASDYITISKSAYTPIYGFVNLPTETAVQAGQGFLINVKKPQSAEPEYPNGTVNRTITFNKGTGGMQVHSTGTSIKRSQSSWPGITLLALAGGRTRSTIVAFNPGMTTSLDPSYDAGLLSVSDFNVYTRLAAGNNETNFTIQCLPDNQYDSLVVPVGLDMPQAGLITFKADGVILPDGVYPVIEDRLDHISTPLKTPLDSLTTYLAEPDWGTGRFYLHFGNSSSLVSTDELKWQHTITASYSNQEITVFGTPETSSLARLFDVNGRMLGSEYRLASDNINRIPARGLQSGIYLLRIDGKTSRQTLKITVLDSR